MRWRASCVRFDTLVAVRDKYRAARKFPKTLSAKSARYLNSAIASSASTPPVIAIGANGALAAMSALDSMI